ncbi:hypothetical protein KX816_18225 [Sphingosinicellaceae bacterium]|nr:hypothetical protein KX816_18225 [Sphingosinicellaceae bacterium]
MRTLAHAAMVAVLLAATLAGCASVRKGLGEYQKAADKGVNIGGPPVDAADSSGGPSNPGKPGKPGKHSDLPSGLGGDKANAQYTSVPQS